MVSHGFVSFSFNARLILPKAFPQVALHKDRVTQIHLELQQQPQRNDSDFFHSLPIQSSHSLLPSVMDSSSSPVVVRRKAVEATPATFAGFGQVISASPDGAAFGPDDAQLQLHQGTPRFYIMHLKDRELKFDKITHHASVTQCLGSVGGAVWYLGVAKASILGREGIDNATQKNVMQSRCGHYYVPPNPDDVQVFRISGPKFLKLNTGTWHAGPLFDVAAMDFYNLELSNTNVVDHTTHDFAKEDGVAFLVE